MPGRGGSNPAGASLLYHRLKVLLKYADEDFVGMPTTTAILEIEKIRRAELHDPLELFGDKNRTRRGSSTKTLGFQVPSKIDPSRLKECIAPLEALSRSPEFLTLHLNFGGAV